MLPQLRGDKLKHCPEFLYERASGFQLLLLSSVGFFFSFLPSFMSSSAGAAVITIPGGVELVLKYVIKRINNSYSCSRAGQRDRQTFRTGKERRKAAHSRGEEGDAELVL